MLVGQIALGIVWAADIRKDIELLKLTDRTIHEQIETSAKNNESTVKQVQEQLTRIDSKMDRLIERRN